MTPELPKLIRIERVGQSFTFEIDGVPFPYVVAGDRPVTVRMQHGDMATVELTLLAERVEFIDDPLNTPRGPSV